MGKSIVAVLVYYDLFSRPLSALEIFKYLPPSPGASFFSVIKAIRESVELEKIIQQKNGLYFLVGRQSLLPLRVKRMKNAQLKWRRLKKTVSCLALVPFLRLAAATGSLTANNTEASSDLDLLIVAAQGRLWSVRFFTTILTGVLGVRRHGRLIKNRLCFNYYLTEENLNVAEEASQHFWHSAQEYARLVPVLENEPAAYEKFLNQNYWLAGVLNIFPWQSRQTAHSAKSGRLAYRARAAFEHLLKKRIGNWLEKILGRSQGARILKKSRLKSAGEFYINDHCLMFHPQSESRELMKKFDLKMKQLLAQ